jgi:antitoxin component of RelBE/YafQ-DinJ toxin-antitoxin module
MRLSSTSPKSLIHLKEIFAYEKNKIIDHIDEYYTSYGEENNKLKPQIIRFADVSLADGTFLNTLLNMLRKEIIKKESIPFYLLYDEANELLDFQKKIINTIISQRKHGLVSVKVSCQPLSYNVFEDIKGRPIEETHDYYLMELDSLYTNDKSSYYDRIKEIAERRLKIAGCKTLKIEDLIPENPAEIKKLQEATKQTEKEYDKLPANLKPKDEADYVKKYAMARFFQDHLKKTSYSYTGFNNLVHFSSGIIRSFLEPCYSMFEDYVQRNPGSNIKEIATIPIQIQRDVIERYSNSFITKEIISPLKIEPIDSEKRKILEGLGNLLEAMGELFSMRLKNKQSREPRIISFAIKESRRDIILQKILDHGVRKAFFHQKWYRAKSGHEMLECYILNRRLCPRFHLDLSSFQGRTEVTQDDLLLAIKNPKDFIKKYEQEPSLENAQLQLFDF